VLWAILLVGVAAAAGFAELSPWVIAGLEFGVWVGVAASERTLSGPWTTRAVAMHNSSADSSETLAPEAPLSNGQRTPQAGPSIGEERPARSRSAAAARPAVPVVGPRWNVWMLEQLVRDEAPDNEELEYLVASLREYADSNGILPAGFDQLVRESFGSLLPRAG
jgi:hypothetical protein